MQTPKGFVTLRDIASKTNQSINIIGVVTDFLSPAPSRGADWQCCLRITDGSGAFQGQDGIRIKFFRPREQLPEVESLGSVAVCRNVKITSFQGMLSAISTRATECLIFSRATIPSPSYDLAYQGRKQDLPHASFPPYAKPTVEEQVFAIHLYDSCGKELNYSSLAIAPKENDRSRLPGTLKSVEHQFSSTVLPNKRTPKFSLIKDIADFRFSDLLVEIIKIYPCNDGSVEIYVTDYTHNGLLFHYSSPKENLGEFGTENLYEYSGIQNKNKWPGPYGKMTLQIKVWPPHSSWIHENVKEEEYVFLRNVRIKTSLDARLEGSLHSDRQYPDRIDVQQCRLNDTEVVQLLRRKQEYWKRFGANDTDDKGGSMTKAERKRRRRREKKGRNISVNAGNLASTSKITSNQHVKCANPQIPLSTIEQIENCPHRSFKPPNEPIITLPFVNMKFRLRVRVVDYWPRQLEDFSRSITDPAYNPMTSSESDDSGCETGSNSSASNQYSPSPPARNWEWAFYLLVEEVKGNGPSCSSKPSKMPLLVAHDDAVHLLKLDASNLRKHASLLAQLREKLFVLWGNLEDVKDGKETNLSSRPFETCVREYGVRTADEWNRIHSMFGTTIM